MRKKSSPSQLPLHLPLEAARAREDLMLSTANHDAVAYIDAWPNWPAAITILAGPVGSGKTHLAHIWASRANAGFLATSLDDPDLVPQEGNYVVEDIAQGSFSERWMFHLINAARASGSSLLFTSTRWPADWGVVLADLQSRLKTSHLVELHEPDDELLAGVLTKLFSDRQLQIETPLIDYLVPRMERSLDSAQKLVGELDALSLSHKKPVTKHLAAQALQNLEFMD